MSRIACRVGVLAMLNAVDKIHANKDTSCTFTTIAVIAILQALCVVDDDVMLSAQRIAAHGAQ